MLLEIQESFKCKNKYKPLKNSDKSREMFIENPFKLNESP